MKKENKNVNVLAFFSGKLASARIHNPFSPFLLLLIHSFRYILQFIYQTELCSGNGYNLGDAMTLEADYGA